MTVLARGWSCDKRVSTSLPAEASLSLLRQIQDGAVASDEPLAQVLRRTLILSARLSHEPLRQWVGAEIEGYRGGIPVPDYRRFALTARGHFVGPTRQLSSALINPAAVLPEIREFLTEQKDLGFGVGSIEDLLTGDGSPQIPMPAVVVRAIGSADYYGVQCIEAWWDVPKAILVSILDTVRKRLLDFALVIESENPSAGESHAGERPVAPERVNQLFQTIIMDSHIHGDVGTGDSVAQSGGRVGTDSSRGRRGRE